MSGSDRRAHWRGLIEEHEGSGESAAAFCRERGVSLPGFYSWRRRLKEDNGAGATEPGFVELVTPGTGPRITVRVNDQLNIGVEPGFDAATLKAVVETLSPAAS